MESPSKDATYRPDNLPPKDPAEAENHRNLVTKNIRTHLESLKRKLKEDKRRREIALRKEAKIKKNQTIWEKKILPYWDRTRNSKKTIELWREGLPPKIRGTVWLRTTGNALGITEEYFDINIGKAT